MKVRIAETFTSIQGEGSELGTPMHFVRLAGCSVSSCPLHPASSNLCDTNWSFRREATAEELIAGTSNFLWCREDLKWFLANLAEGQ